MMTQEAGDIALALVGAYHPRAIYYEEADVVEYIRSDTPCVHRRVDQFLTLVLDMTTREPIGFALKGFRNYYLKHIKPTQADVEFVRLTGVLEDAVEVVGTAVFNDPAIREGYKTAQSIAESDKVELHELPKAA